MKNLEKYIGAFFIHTAKAIRKGCPNYRLYCVVKVEEDEDGQFLCAWKCDRESKSIFSHPAFGLISVDTLSAYDLCNTWEKAAESSPMPTAKFIPDSFYHQVTLQKAIEKLVPVS